MRRNSCDAARVVGYDVSAQRWEEIFGKEAAVQPDKEGLRADVVQRKRRRRPAPEQAPKLLPDQARRERRDLDGTEPPVACAEPEGGDAGLPEEAEIHDVGE